MQEAFNFLVYQSSVFLLKLKIEGQEAKKVLVFITAGKHVENFLLNALSTTCLHFNLPYRFQTNFYFFSFMYKLLFKLCHLAAATAAAFQEFICLVKVF